MPSEYVKVPLQHVAVDAFGNTIKTDLEIWAGFTGLEQNNQTFALKPQIGWMIRKRDPQFDKTLAMRFAHHANDDYMGGGISIRVEKVPEELLNLPKIKLLSIDFLGEIIIPEKMKEIQIEKFSMTGKVSDEEIKRICDLLPNTRLEINGDYYKDKMKVSKL